MAIGRSGAVLLALLLCSGCGGGGGSGSAPQTGAAHATSLTATFSLTLPVVHATTSALRRSVDYVSPSSESIEIDVVYPTQTIGGAIVDLTPPSTVCTVSNTTETCEIAIVAQAGATSFVLRMYDQPQAKGNLLSTNTVPVPATTSGYANIAVTLLPVAAGITLVNTVPFVLGIPSTSALTITTVDADGNVIPNGPLDAPITLTSNSPDFTLSATSVNDTTTPVTITYDGGTAPNAQLIALVGGTTYTFNPLGTPGYGPLVIAPANLMLQVGGAPGTFTASEAGSPGSIAITAACVNGAAIALAPARAPIGVTTTVTVTAVTAPSGTPVHACTLTFAGPAATATATVDVNVSTVGIQGAR